MSQQQKNLPLNFRNNTFFDDPFFSDCWKSIETHRQEFRKEFEERKRLARQRMFENSKLSMASPFNCFKDLKNEVVNTDNSYKVRIMVIRNRFVYNTL